MACNSCTMEGFAQMPQHEFFNNKKDCLSQPAQTCIYTAQGEMVCNKDAGAAGQAKQLAPVGVEQFVRESRPPHQ